jgi:hypothetical protein
MSDEVPMQSNSSSDDEKGDEAEKFKSKFLNNKKGNF